MKVNNDLPLQELAVFAAVAETEGFTPAAKRLGVSKAMASIAITRLESRLGVRLFQRTTRRLSLTESGAAMLPHAQRAISAARDAADAAGETLASPRGLLRVTAPMSFGLLHVVPALGLFARRYPDLRVDLVLDDRVLDLVAGGFELAIRIGALSDSTLIAQKIGKSRNTFVASPDYLRREGAPQKPEDLLEHAALVYSLSPTGSRWTLAKDKQTETVVVQGKLLANSSLALRQALLQGLGIARMPWFVVGRDLADKRLVRVLPEWEPPEQGIHAVTTARDYVPRKTRAFIDFLRARIGEVPYWERQRSTR